jgi:hypothetical protein
MEESVHVHGGVNMVRSFVVVAFVGVAVVACRPAAPPPPAVAFDPKTVAHIRQEGGGKIAGQAFLVLPNGQTRLASGETVRLIPDSPYARARFETLYQGRKFVRARDWANIPADPAYTALIRTTTTTSAGHFRFDGVAPGRYFVATQKVYQPQDALLPEGGAMYETVEVKGDETARIVIVGR